MTMGRGAHVDALGVNRL